MSATELRDLEDALYRASDSYFFRDEPNPGPDGENLDIPAYLRRGVQLSKPEGGHR